MVLKIVIVEDEKKEAEALSSLVNENPATMKCAPKVRQNFRRCI